MKPGGPWNLRGLRPETVEAAREAARRSGMSVGEWLNNVIRQRDDYRRATMQQFGFTYYSVGRPPVVSVDAQR